MRSAYALRSERKISDTDNYLPFFHRQITSLSHRPNFFYQNTIMSTPPPSPSVDYMAIADLHTAGAASTTPAPPLRDAAAAVLAFSSSGKRHSTEDRDGTVSGTSSPVKKRSDTRSSPRKRVSIDSNVVVHVDDRSDAVFTLNSSFESPLHYSITPNSA